jgi:hypothetical protein
MSINFLYFTMLIILESLLPLNKMAQSRNVRFEVGSLDVSSGKIHYGKSGTGVNIEFDGENTLHIDPVENNNIIHIGGKIPVDVQISGVPTDLFWDASSGSLTNNGLYAPFYPDTPFDVIPNGVFGPINITTPLTLIQIDTNDTYNYTLADGIAAGQVKTLRKQEGSGIAVITPASFLNGTTITMSGAGSITLLWNGSEWFIADFGDNNGIPAGGLAGQVLVKSSNDDYDVEWVAGGGEGGGGTWGSITGLISNQTDLQDALDDKADTASLADVATSGSYNDLDDTPDISNFETTTQLNTRDTNNRDRINHTGTQNVGSVVGGGAFNLAGFDTDGALTGLGGFQYNSSPAGGLSFFKTVVPSDTDNFNTFHIISANYNPTVTDSDETWQHLFLESNIGEDNSGNQLGGGAIGISCNVNSRQSSDFGNITQMRTSSQIGNGTDPIEGDVVEGWHCSINMANNASVEDVQFISLSMLGDATSEITRNLNMLNLFGQCPDIGDTYRGINASPFLANFKFGSAFTDFTGHSGTGEGYSSAILSPTLDEITNFYQGLTIGPTIASCKNFIGLQVSSNNVNVFPGVIATLEVQDLTFSAKFPGEDGNNLQVEYITGGTAGSEGITFAASKLTVQIEDGVSTATQIKDAVEGSPAFLSFNTAISGTGSNAQTVFAATNLSGGEWPGQNLSAQFNGDVQINGGLTFEGPLSIEILNAFGQFDAIDGGGQPSSVHSLITGISIEEDAVLTSADTIGVNTASLILIGENASVGTTFLGISALALPAVVSMQTGSTIDRVAGATFALSLDGSATGGTINELYLCRALQLPNGITTVTTTYGYDYSAPFGTPNFTNIYPFHTAENFNSYFRGGLVVGEGGKDMENASTLLEVNSTTGAFLNARMTSTQRDALTAINGMQIYNTSTDKLQVYAGGTWVDLH